MPSSEVVLLFSKEVRQLTRNTGVMLTSLFIPAVLIVLAPVLAILASHTRGYRNLRIPELTQRLPGFTEIRIPGEQSAKNRARLARDGLEIDRLVYDRLSALAGVNAPARAR